MKEILIAAFVIALAIIAMPSFADPVGYTATVAFGQDTHVSQPINGNFGTLLRGDIKTINNSLILSNTGDMDATVSARFSTNASVLYGLVNGSNVIGASNFSLKAGSGNWTGLDNAGADVNGVVIVPFGGTNTILDARLNVPINQPPGAYDGTVILTFGTVV
jgi:hypothetical protein